ncbi:MAG: hypothetical protein HUJ56_08515, partial [Erysipelotrichaceae bacterium]|nr:hypothetical protein [Erysipelotrichaceae bacterium]
MKKSLLVAAVLLSIGSGCLMPQEVGASTSEYYWDKEGQTWVYVVSKATATDNEAVLPKDGFPVSEGDNFYAGYSDGDVKNNSFTIENITTKIYIVNGGFSFDGNAEGNTVTITGSSEVAKVYGGSSIYGNALGNTVTISDKSNVGEVDGGYSSYGNAEGNVVTITGSSEVGYVYGGYSFKNAKDNKVTINGGSVTEVYGGVGNGGYATGNTVIINGGTVEIATGGYSTGGNPTGNTVIINGGQVDLAIGAYSEYKEVQGNEVIISNSTGEEHVGDVYASATGSDNNLLNSNIVTWKDGDVQGNIFGGALYAFDFSTGDSGFTPVENAGGIFNVYHSSGSSSKTIAEGKSIA